MAEHETRIREAEEEDVPAILDIFAAVYGDDYPYKCFRDAQWLKRSVFSDDILMLVAEDENSSKVLGTASVVLDIGAHTDLIGEMGRLAVHTDARGRGVGKQLMAARIAHVRDRLHLAVVENRTPHAFSQRISLAHDFAPVGFLPLKHRFDERESIALFARHFGAALTLRRNNPRIVPEAHELAHLVLEECGFPFDAIVDESSPPYPQVDRFELRDFTAEGYPALIRIERGRIKRREVFGPMRLQYGFFKLAARQATYLVASHPAAGERTPAVAGAVGFIHDRVDRVVRIFELIAQDDRAIHFLLGRLLDHCIEREDIEYLEVDVSAHAPRMQRTLVEHGFLPVAYVPAMAFHNVERLDVIKMARLLIPPILGEMDLTPGVAMMADVVMRGFRRQAVLPEVAEALHTLDLFRDLSDEQSLRVASACTVARYAAGERLFARGKLADEVFILLEGEVDVAYGEPRRTVGRVHAGESLGEIALLTGMPRSATASAHSDVAAAVLSRAAFVALARQRPDIGTVLYRNLALGLGRKLHRLDQEVSAD